MRERRLEELEVPERIREALRRLASRLQERLREFELYLFGSYARGDWVNGLSDVDLIVVSKSFTGIPLPGRSAIVRKLALALGGVARQLQPYYHQCT